MAASWMGTFLPLGAIPANSPRWVPLDVNRMTTRPPSGMMSATFSFQSGNAARWPATSPLIPCIPFHSVPPTKWQIKSAEYNSSATARLPLLHSSASDRRMIALLSDKVEFGREEQPTRLAAVKVMQATRRVFMKRDYSEFRNSLVPGRLELRRQRGGSVGLRWPAYFSSGGLRNKNNPRLRTWRPWVRERFDEVEIPLNRTKKSQNFFSKPLFTSSAITTSSSRNRYLPEPGF